MKRSKGKEIVFQSSWNLIMIILSVIILYPILYMLFGAMLTKQEFLESGILPFPSTISLDRFENFTKIFIANGLVQSVLITILRTLFYAFANIFFSTLGGYIFAHVPFRGSKVVFLMYMSTMMIPGISMMVPSYIILARFPFFGGNNFLGQGGTGLIDDVSILFVTGWISVYNMFLMRQSMMGIGSDLSEAAELDGASRFYTVFKIYMPLTLPVIAVMMIGLFIGMWNDYTTCLIYLPSHTQFHTIGTKIVDLLNDGAIIGYEAEPNYPAIYGVSIMFIIPPVVCFLIFQKQIIGGLTMGAVKG